MAVAKWIGASLNRRQIATGLVAGTWAQGDTETLTIANVDFVITIGTLTTTSQVATTIKQAFNGETLTDTSASCIPSIADGGGQAIAQFRHLSASVSSATVSFTTDESGALGGKPFTMSEAETTAGDGAVTYSNAATAATSQYHANQADNWDGNAVPANGDTVIFDTGSLDCRWELDLGAITVAQLTKYKSYTGNVGLARTNNDDTAYPHSEYRTPRYLTADGFTIADLEVGEGTGSSRFYLDAGSVASTINIYGKGNRAETGLPCILFIGTSTSNVVRNLAGDLGIAFYGNEAASLTTLISGDGPASQASTICGTGVTFSSATVTCNGGFLETASAFATGVQNAGNWFHKAGTVTSMTVNKGAVHYPMGAATYTTLDINGGRFDCTKGSASFTITNTVTLSAGSEFIDPQGRTGNPVFQLRDCTLADVKIVLPQGKTFTPS